MVLVHMVPAFQVWSQPHFEFVESFITKQFHREDKSRTLMNTLTKGFWMRFWYRTGYVCIVTFLAILLPFFSVILGFVGAVGFWPATVFFPIHCWIKVFRPQKPLRYFLRGLDIFCLFVTCLAIAGSIEQMIDQAKNIQLFRS